MGTPGPGGLAQALLTPGPRSDYAYLREHFREKHFLCEEGRCSTEQFTHAFRTEIDLKAHRTACHSRSRAEARQNRQIDLQFSYTPRHSRRSEGERGPHCLRSLQGSDPGPMQPLSVSGDDGQGCEHVGVGAWELLTPPGSQRASALLCGGRWASSLGQEDYRAPAVWGSLLG